MKKSFINDAYEYAIQAYIEEKDNKEGVIFNSFPVVVIRLLSIIYDELDILTPYQLSDESIFYSNLQKYGYPLSSVVEFNNLFLSFYQKEDKDIFVKIQKMLVDMYVKKKVTLNVNETEINEFKDLLYSPNASNSLIASYNFKMANNPNEVLNYCDELFANNSKQKIEKDKVILPIDAYEALKISMNDIDNMDAEQLKKANKEVYDFFSVNENAINRDYLLNKAVYDYNHPKLSFAASGGFANVIYVLVVIAILALIVFIVTLVIT